MNDLFCKMLDKNVLYHYEGKSKNDVNDGSKGKVSFNFGY